VPLCTYFLGGLCRFGDGCRYRHALADPACVAFFEEEIRKQQDRDGPSHTNAGTGTIEAPEGCEGNGGSGSGAAEVMAAAAAMENAFAQDSARWQQGMLPLKDCLLQRAVAAGLAHDPAEAEVAFQLAERSASEELCCGICLDEVLSEPGRRFGLLTSCAHPFCLECIRSWRARIDLPRETVRACPVCRKPSYFVIPCDRFVADPARKAAINAEYNQGQGTIPCRNWAYGKGTCAFGSSCFYAHLNPDGSIAVVVKPALRLDAEGNVTVTKDYKLSEFLFRQ
jgi:E3 ubiquitin-protein ligase makorin